MKTRWIAILVAAFLGLAVVMAQIEPTGPVDDRHDWEMFSQNVDAAAAGGQAEWDGRAIWGETFLYNKRTGTVYVYGNCTSGDDKSACMWRLPVVDDRDGWWSAPEPKTLRD